jgi:prepilin-type N-terminal cleavage/methylation domain-containing protein
MMRRRSNGFTLIEMLVTISMAGILAAITTASIQPQLQKRRLIEGSQQIEQIIRKAQQTAITKARTTYIQFNLNPVNTYTFVVGDPCRPDTKATPLVDNPAIDRIQSVSTENLPDGVNIVAPAVAANALNDGVCPAPVAGSQDLNLNIPKPNILAFDFKGRVMNNNAGNRYIRLQHAVGNFGKYDTFVLTVLGDIGTVQSP